LSLLQKRTRTALVDHFRRRSLHSRAALALFQARSSDNDQKIDELSNAVHRISAFLHCLTDDSTTTDNAQANEQVGVDADLKNSEKPTVQITA
uniref:Si:dkeyp-7a3.1 n=1 Tax=Paramormyrops kingsleyae TaxID=1676925 RepID=A0A3B3R434_9TELE